MSYIKRNPQLYGLHLPCVGLNKRRFRGLRVGQAGDDTPRTMIGTWLKPDIEDIFMVVALGMMQAVVVFGAFIAASGADPGTWLGPLQDIVLEPKTW